MKKTKRRQFNLQACRVKSDKVNQSPARLTS